LENFGLDPGAGGLAEFYASAELTSVLKAVDLGTAKASLAADIGKAKEADRVGNGLHGITSEEVIPNLCLTIAALVILLAR
jgi:hypothetical protein